ncbi:MAG: hypothetical protein JWL63_1180 [Rhodocyclales bacterium]|nr:hypothetical protein [Rhodocyclales bacterium]
MSIDTQGGTRPLPGADMMDAFSAVRNWRALTLTLATLLVLAALGGLTGYLAFSHGFLSLLCFILTAGAALVGYSAVGSQLMAEAKGDVPPSLADSLLLGVVCTPRLVGAGLSILAIVIVMLLALAVILFICKIPGIGNALYGIVLPVASIIMGVTFYAAFNVSAAVLAPAIWEGHGVFAALSRLLAVLRQRPLEILIRLILLGFLVAFTAMIIGGILISGYMVVQGMAAGMHVGMSMPEGYSDAGNAASPFMHVAYGREPFNPYAERGVLGGLGSFMPGGGGSAFGTGVLFAIGATLPVLIFIKGLCLIYLRTMDGLDVSGSAAMLQGSLDKAREKARQASERAAQMQANARASAAKPTAETPAADPDQTVLRPSASAQRYCIGCKAPLAADDVFCGECGTRNG